MKKENDKEFLLKVVHKHLTSTKSEFGKLIENNIILSQGYKLCTNIKFSTKIKPKIIPNTNFFIFKYSGNH